jgi:membrane protein YqaA with SNARE-associated domain
MWDIYLRVIAMAAIYIAAAAVGNTLGGSTGVLVAVLVASIPIWVWITHWRRSLQRQ